MLSSPRRTKAERCPWPSRPPLSARRRSSPVSRSPRGATSPARMPARCCAGGVLDHDPLSEGHAARPSLPRRPPHRRAGGDLLGIERADGDIERLLASVAPELERSLGAGLHRGDGGQGLRRALDRLAVDTEQHAAGLDAAFSAGLPFSTCATSAPRGAVRPKDCASDWLTSWIETPRRPRSTLPCCTSCVLTWATSTGVANASPW